jgi:hypothetical protein
MIEAGKSWDSIGQSSRAVEESGGEKVNSEGLHVGTAFPPLSVENWRIDRSLRHRVFGEPRAGDGTFFIRTLSYLGSDGHA